MKRFRDFVQRQDARQRFYRQLSGEAKVLDMGCGSGINGIALRNIYPSINVYGIDILPEADVPEFYTYKQVNLEEGVLPFPDNEFDAIVLTHVIEHLHSPLSLGNEIRRVLRNGGRLYVETPNWKSILVPSFGFHRDQLNPFNFFDDPTHIRPWTKHSLFLFLFQSCHLRVAKIATARIWLRVPFDFLIIAWALVRGNRGRIVTSFWNIYGWCIFGIGVKE